MLTDIYATEGYRLCNRYANESTNLATFFKSCASANSATPAYKARCYAICTPYSVMLPFMHSLGSRGLSAFGSFR